jgi:hypothetical protein
MTCWTHFEYNFDLDHDNSKESVFAILNNVGDGTRFMEILVIQ